MTNQLSLFDEEEFKYQPPQLFTAIYFRMGHYNIDDGLSDLVGFDCPFDDSDVLEGTVQDLKVQINEVYDGQLNADLASCYPDIIVDMKGNIREDIYLKLCKMDLNPDNMTYSHGQESLTQFWEREKWRWVKEY